MEREIKFRFFTPDKRMIIDHNGWVEDIGINQALSLSAEYGYKRMQFIGIFDKNGVPIFEDDIITDYHGQRFRVVFQDHGFWCLYPDGSAHMPSEPYREVIGNFWQNPDLLTTSKD